MVDAFRYLRFEDIELLFELVAVAAMAAAILAVWQNGRDRDRPFDDDPPPGAEADSVGADEEFLDEENGVQQGSAAVAADDEGGKLRNLP